MALEGAAIARQMGYMFRLRALVVGYSVTLRDGFESTTAWRRLAAEIIARVGCDDEAFEPEKAFLVDAARLGTADKKRINLFYRFF